MATRPVVASHTGVRGVCDNARNLSDAHVRGIADTGGMHRHRLLADRLRRRRRRVDRAVDPLRGRPGRRGPRRARLRLRRRGPGAVRRDRARPADRCAARGRTSTTAPSPRSWAATSAGCSPRRCPTRGSRSASIGATPRRSHRSPRDRHQQPGSERRRARRRRARDDRLALEAARLHLPVERDLRRHQRGLGLRSARRRAEEQRQARLVAGDGPGARRHRRTRCRASSCTRRSG